MTKLSININKFALIRNARGINQGGEDSDKPAPTAQKVAGEFANSPGKDKSTSYKKEVKADKADHSDKSGKSPISGK